MRKKMMALIIAAAMVLSGCGAEKAQIQPVTPSESAASPTTEASKEEASAEVPTSESASTEEASAEEASTETASSADTDATGKVKTMGASIDKFNWKLFSKMAGDKNLFYSPYSLESALVMADAGAAGSTKEQMEEVLGIDDLDAFLGGYQQFMSRKQADTAKLTTANSLWADKDYIAGSGAVNSAYSDKMKKYMGTELYETSFRSDLNSALSDITNWVGENTGDLIPDYKAIADQDTVIDIINAVYFYGEWQNKFTAQDTSKQDFKGRTATKQADMMSMSDVYFNYYDGNGFRGLELPYSDGNTVMDLIITDKDDEAKEVGTKWAALADKDKTDFISSLDSAETKKISSLMLPKFTMDLTAENLKEDLQSLGMKDAFSAGSADFSGIADKLYISDINHRAKIEVDEEGSRAAAVTEVQMALTSMAPDDEEKILFICDHPFIFVIRNKESGVTLFTGMINDL